MQMSAHGRSQEIEHVTLLLLERGDGRQHPLDVAAAFGAVSAEGALFTLALPEDPAGQGS